MNATATCERCGNAYDKPLVVRTFGDATEHTFDSFECAIDALAPRCAHCDIRIVGHGVEDDGKLFCCANCARMEGATSVADRGDGATAATAGIAPTRPPSDG